MGLSRKNMMIRDVRMILYQNNPTIFSLDNAWKLNRFTQPPNLTLYINLPSAKISLLGLMISDRMIFSVP